MKTIVSDLDGTLLNSYGVVDPFTKEVLNTSPIYRIIATGRSYKTASPLLKGVDIDYCVLLNGAECRNSQGNILYKENIDLKIAHTIMNGLLERHMDFEINTEEGDYSTDTVFCDTTTQLSEQHLQDYKEIRKIFVFVHDEQKINQIKYWLDQIEGINVTSSSWWNIEVTSMNANKALMVKRVIETLHTSDDVYVFGDGYNDLSLFKDYKHTRAMSNGVNALKQIAEKVIDSNDDHSVAKEIIDLVKD